MEIADITRPPLELKPIALRTETKTLKIDLAKAAILIIDMQNDFCHPDGWLAHIAFSMHMRYRFFLDSRLRGNDKF